MRIGLLGTGFGLAHARIYHSRADVDGVVVFGRTLSKLEQFATEFGFVTTTDIDRIYDDAAIDLVDVCLPTALHADHVIRALERGKHVLCELPLATTMVDARRVVDAHAASDRGVFVDMAGRFDPGVEFLSSAIAAGTYGTLKTLHIGIRTALLWEGYELGLDSIALDVMHGSLDTVATALGLPNTTTAVGVASERGSAAEVLLGYPNTIVHCSASALMPTHYGMRGGWHAAFTDAVIESTWTAGWDGRPTATLIEHTDSGARDIDLPDVDAYSAVIDHVFDCLAGRTHSRLAPASVLDSLQVTLDIHHALTSPTNG
ncbi:MAG TPA: Gfo/Idh/MocA family oxidoreductase [Jiangellaceae bacterium]|nr:Gfo/Idh/MocA family oxidoreductase [Jiangellaceae bacterium]